MTVTGVRREMTRCGRPPAECGQDRVSSAPPAPSKASPSAPPRLIDHQRRRGTDSVEVANNLILPDVNLSINAESITVDTGVTIDTTNAGADGAIAFTAATTQDGAPPAGTP